MCACAVGGRRAATGVDVTPTASRRVETGSTNQRHATGNFIVWRRGGVELVPRARAYPQAITPENSYGLGRGNEGE